MIYIQKSLWDDIIPKDVLLNKIGWTLAENNQLLMNTVITIFELQNSS